MLGCHLEEEMATHSSVLAWRIPGTGEPGGLLSMGSHRVGHDWSDLTAATAAAGCHCCCLVAKLCTTLVTTWTCIDCHVPLSMGFPRQDYWSIFFSRESSWPRGWTHISCIAGGLFTTEPPGKPLGCHLCVCLVAQSCPTLCDPMDCSPPDSSVHGDSPGKNPGVGCYALLQGIFPTQGLNPGLLYYRQILYHLSQQGSP